MFMILFALTILPSPINIADFSDKKEADRWVVVDDGVMGGRSEGNVKQIDKKHIRYWGDVSLKNNGGFSSLRKNMSEQKIKGATIANIRMKGDGKEYQFRVKNNQSERHSYKYTFKTSGEWETISIPLNEMTPTFRGYTPDLPNYQAKTLAQVSILIANKKAESFELEMEKIWLE
jgi:NADH dehydrogenase [ubiquinone] 1 alpha subcomplex assembly factor 1